MTASDLDLFKCAPEVCSVSTTMSTERVPSTIIWSKVFFFTIFHFFAFDGLYFLLTRQVAVPTLIWCKYHDSTIITFLVVFLFLCTVQGVTSGGHRLWAHRTYKAKLPLRLLLGLFQTLTFQHSIWKWCRDHRAHHKYSDTDADPHNSSRGLFYSHIGWLLVEPHPEYLKKIREIDCSDLRADPVVYYQNKYFIQLVVLIAFVVPTAVPWYFWNEGIYVAFTIAGALRYITVLHFTWLTNSAAHKWGARPYDRNIKPTQSWLVAALLSGEGAHNYHHTFPWDYRGVELDGYTGTFTSAFIDFMVKIGQAYDVKTASWDLVQKRMKRTGQNQY